eukprot:3705284-Prymnesium_polylepis.1
MFVQHATTPPALSHTVEQREQEAMVEATAVVAKADAAFASTLDAGEDNASPKRRKLAPSSVVSPPSASEAELGSDVDPADV